MHQHLIAAQTWNHLNGKPGKKLLEAVAANGPVSLQAHTDKLEILADKEVTVISTTSTISINAKTKIVLKAGQTSITLDGANITFACPGTFSVKGALESLDSGASSAAVLGRLPDSRVKRFDEQFQLKDPNGKPLQEVYYKVEGQNDQDISQTQKDGKSLRLGGDSSEKLKFELRWHKIRA